MTTDRDAAAAAYAEPLILHRENINRAAAVETAFRSGWDAGWDAAMEWRDIESAPKDGSQILLHKNGKVWAGFYDMPSDRWCTCLETIWLECAQDDYGEMKWWWDRENGPSEWMPLPQPPASTGEGA